jgi:uncharacterized membrane protein
VAGFAVAGFLLPLLLLVFHANGALLIYLCPPAIVAWAFAIDGPGWLPKSGVLWLVMCLANAILYAALAFVVAIIYRAIRPVARLGGFDSPS